MIFCTMFAQRRGTYINNINKGKKIAARRLRSFIDQEQEGHKISLLEQRTVLHTGN